MKTVTILFGERIRTLRNATGLSQEELAFNASISTNHLGQIERDQKCPTIETASLIANALDIPLTQLFDFQEEIPTKDYTVIDKITTQLVSFTPTQQEEILKLLKLLQHFNG